LAGNIPKEPISKETKVHPNENNGVWYTDPDYGDVSGNHPGCMFWVNVGDIRRRKRDEWEQTSR